MNRDKSRSLPYLPRYQSLSPARSPLPLRRQLTSSLRSVSQPTQRIFYVDGTPTRVINSYSIHHSLSPHRSYKIHIRSPKTGSLLTRVTRSNSAYDINSSHVYTSQEDISEKSIREGSSRWIGSTEDIYHKAPFFPDVTPSESGVSFGESEEGSGFVGEEDNTSQNSFGSSSAYYEVTLDSEVERYDSDNFSGTDYIGDRALTTLHESDLHESDSRRKLRPQWTQQEHLGSEHITTTSSLSYGETRKRELSSNQASDLDKFQTKFHALKVSIPSNESHVKAERDSDRFSENKAIPSTPLAQSTPHASPGGRSDFKFQATASWNADELEESRTRPTERRKLSTPRALLKSESDAANLSRPEDTSCSSCSEDNYSDISNATISSPMPRKTKLVKKHSDKPVSTKAKTQQSVSDYIQRELVASHASQQSNNSTPGHIFFNDSGGILTEKESQQVRETSSNEQATSEQVGKNAREEWWMAYNRGPEFTESGKKNSIETLSSFQRERRAEKSPTVTMPLISAGKQGQERLRQLSQTSPPPSHPSTTWSLSPRKEVFRTTKMGIEGEDQDAPPMNTNLGDSEGGRVYTLTVSDLNEFNRLQQENLKESYSSDLVFGAISTSDYINNINQCDPNAEQKSSARRNSENEELYESVPHTLEENVGSKQKDSKCKTFIENKGTQSICYNETVSRMSKLDDPPSYQLVTTYTPGTVFDNFKIVNIETIPSTVSAESIKEAPERRTVNLFPENDFFSADKKSNMYADLISEAVDGQALSRTLEINTDDITKGVDDQAVNRTLESSTDDISEAVDGQAVSRTLEISAGQISEVADGQTVSRTSERTLNVLSVHTNEISVADDSSNMYIVDQQSMLTNGTDSEYNRAYSSERSLRETFTTPDKCTGFANLPVAQVPESRYGEGAQELGKSNQREAATSGGGREVHGQGELTDREVTTRALNISEFESGSEKHADKCSILKAGQTETNNSVSAGEFSLEEPHLRHTFSSEDSTTSCIPETLATVDTDSCFMSCEFTLVPLQSVTVSKHDVCEFTRALPDPNIIDVPVNSVFIEKSAITRGVFRGYVVLEEPSVTTGESSIYTFTKEQACSVSTIGPIRCDFKEDSSIKNNESSSCDDKEKQSFSFKMPNSCEIKEETPVITSETNVSNFAEEQLHLVSTDSPTKENLVNITHHGNRDLKEEPAVNIGVNNSYNFKEEIIINIGPSNSCDIKEEPSVKIACYDSVKELSHSFNTGTSSSLDFSEKPPFNKDVDESRICVSTEEQPLLINTGRSHGLECKENNSVNFKELSRYDSTGEPPHSCNIITPNACDLKEESVNLEPSISSVKESRDQPVVERRDDLLTRNSISNSKQNHESNVRFQSATLVDVSLMRRNTTMGACIDLIADSGRERSSAECKATPQIVPAIAAAGKTQKVYYCSYVKQETKNDNQSSNLKNESSANLLHQNDGLTRHQETSVQYPPEDNTVKMDKIAKSSTLVICDSNSQQYAAADSTVRLDTMAKNSTMVTCDSNSQQYVTADTTVKLDKMAKNSTMFTCDSSSQLYRTADILTGQDSLAKKSTTNLSYSSSLHSPTNDTTRELDRMIKNSAVDICDSSSQQYVAADATIKLDKLATENMIDFCISGSPQSQLDDSTKGLEHVAKSNTMDVCDSKSLQSQIDDATPRWDKLAKNSTKNSCDTLSLQSPYVDTTAESDSTLINNAKDFCDSSSPQSSTQDTIRELGNMAKNNAIDIWDSEIDTHNSIMKHGDTARLDSMHQEGDSIDRSTGIRRPVVVDGSIQHTVEQCTKTEDQNTAMEDIVEYPVCFTERVENILILPSSSILVKPTIIREVFTKRVERIRRTTVEKTITTEQREKHRHLEPNSNRVNEWSCLDTVTNESSTETVISEDEECFTTTSTTMYTFGGEQVTPSTEDGQLEADIRGKGDVPSSTTIHSISGLEKKVDTALHANMSGSSTSPVKTSRLADQAPAPYKHTVVDTGACILTAGELVFPGQVSPTVRAESGFVHTSSSLVNDKNTTDMDRTNPLDTLHAQLSLISEDTAKLNSFIDENTYQDHAEATSVLKQIVRGDSTDFAHFSNKSDQGSYTDLYSHAVFTDSPNSGKDFCFITGIDMTKGSQLDREQYDNGYDHVTTDLPKAPKHFHRPPHHLQLLKSGHLLKASSLWTLQEEADTGLDSATPRSSPKRTNINVTVERENIDQESCQIYPSKAVTSIEFLNVDNKENYALDSDGQRTTVPESSDYYDSDGNYTSVSTESNSQRSNSYERERTPLSETESVVADRTGHLNSFDFCQYPSKNASTESNGNTTKLRPGSLISGLTSGSQNFTTGVENDQGLFPSDSATKSFKSSLMFSLSPYEVSENKDAVSALERLSASLQQINAPSGYSDEYSTKSSATLEEIFPVQCSVNDHLNADSASLNQSSSDDFSEISSSVHTSNYNLSHASSSVSPTLSTLSECSSFISTGSAEILEKSTRNHDVQTHTTSIILTPVLKTDAVSQDLQLRDCKTKEFENILNEFNKSTSNVTSEFVFLDEKRADGKDSPFIPEDLYKTFTSEESEKQQNHACIVVEDDSMCAFRFKRYLKKSHTKRRKGRKVLKFLSKLGCVSESVTSPNVSLSRRLKLSQKDGQMFNFDSVLLPKHRVSNPVLVSSASFQHHGLLNVAPVGSIVGCNSQWPSSHSIDSMRSSADSAYSSIATSMIETPFSPDSQRAAADSFRELQTSSGSTSSVFCSGSTSDWSAPESAFASVSDTSFQTQDSSSEIDSTRPTPKHLMGSDTEVISSLCDVFDQLEICGEEIDTALLNRLRHGCIKADRSTT